MYSLLMIGDAVNKKGVWTQISDTLPRGKVQKEIIIIYTCNYFFVDNVLYKPLKQMPHLQLHYEAKSGHIFSWYHIECDLPLKNNEIFK